MKRKLNDVNIPEPSDGKKQKNEHEQPDDSSESFAALNLAPQLLQAIIAQRFSEPTPVQLKVIPAVLSGKDVLARSKTGSGKTAAYVLPILQSILGRKLGSAGNEKAVSALILVPTRELAGQVTKVLQSFTSYCAKDVSVENLTRKEDDKIQRARLAALPDIVIATPGRAAVHINSSSLSLEHVTHIVIDEADLVLSYGYKNDLETMSTARPKGCQVILMSATLREEVTSLNALFCTDPKIITLDDEEKDDGKVRQYIVKCAEDEKFLLAYAIFVLKLIQGKTIIFVGDIDRCYRLKLFLEQFGVRSCVLNSELPVNSRIHVVEEFNRNAYDIIIATDENEVVGQEHIQRSRKSKPTEVDEPESKSVVTQEQSANGASDDIKEPAGESNGAEDAEVANEQVSQPKNKKRKALKTDKDYGVARGIDFKNVSCVLNFDLPPSSKSYIHRIGRTARAGQTGMALSFVIPSDQYRKHKWTTHPACATDEATLAAITASQSQRGNAIEPYAFDMAKLDGFRYRLADALKSVTPGAIREARVRELRSELIKSEKLKRHFEEHPDALRHLRHDGVLRPAKVRAYMKHVPEYMLPAGGHATAAGATTKNGLESGGLVRLNKPVEERRQKKRGHFKRKPQTKARVNPLQSFKGKK